MNYPPAILTLVLLQGPVGADTLIGEGDDGEPYRVTGIVSEGQDRRMALIELPDGEYLRLREGDPLEGGRVLEISRRWLRVDFPEGERRLWLTGLPAGGKAPAPGETAGGERREEKPRLPEHVIKRDLDKDTLAEIRQLAGRTRVSGAGIITVLGPVLDLPLDARILDIDGVSVDDMPDPLGHMTAAFARGNVLTMTLESPEGEPPGRVYLMPEREPPGTQP